jgi:hypothetical protein
VRCGSLEFSASFFIFCVVSFGHIQWKAQIPQPLRGTPNKALKHESGQAGSEPAGAPDKGSTSAIARSGACRAVESISTGQ